MNLRVTGCRKRRTTEMCTVTQKIIISLVAIFNGLTLNAQKNNIRCPEKCFFDYGAKSFTVVCEFQESPSIIWFYNATTFVAKLEGDEKTIYNEGQYDITRKGLLILLDPPSQEGSYKITTEYGEASTLVIGREQAVTTNPRSEDIFTTQHKPATDTLSPGVIVIIIFVAIAIFIVAAVVAVHLLRKNKYAPIPPAWDLTLETQPKTNVNKDEEKKILDDLQRQLDKKLINLEEYLEKLNTELYKGRISEDQYLQSLKKKFFGNEIKSNGFLDSLFHNCYVGKLNSEKYIRELENAEKQQYISKNDLNLKIARAHVGILISRDQFCKAFTHDTTATDNNQIFEEFKSVIKTIDKDMATKLSLLEPASNQWNSLWNKYQKNEITGDSYVKELLGDKRGKEVFILAYLKHLRRAFDNKMICKEDFKEELDWAWTKSLIDKKHYVNELRRSLLDSKISEELFTEWMNFT